MAAVLNPIMEHYKKLTEFLGLALGPDYEIALHDLTDKNRSIIAIANGHISGRDVGAPLTNLALSILRDKSYETSDYRLHYYGVSVNGKDLRSNTFFIKDNDQLIGMLCINFDDTRYREVTAMVMELCHPNEFVSSLIANREMRDNAVINQPMPEKYRNTTDAVAKDAIQRELDRLGVPADRLTAEERVQIISVLESSGIFMLKGAVKDVASLLNCSQASVYRYLSQLKIEHVDRGDGDLPV